MISVEISLLTNNIVIPFQDLHNKYHLKFIELNKLFAINSIAEHGLGYLIKIFEDQEQIAKFIFDSGSSNHTFLHNLDVQAESLYDLDEIIVSHWHYDHFGSLYKILERIDHNVIINTHEDALNERLFIRSKKYNSEFIKGKTKKEITPLLNNSEAVIQEPININKVKKLNSVVEFSSEKKQIFANNELNVYISGEIPRKYEIEDFSNFLSYQEGIYKEDKILDDKSVLLEFQDYSTLITGCCHSGIINTLDYMEQISSKPIKYIIGGLHMAHATKKRIKLTISYFKKFKEKFKSLILFPIHCSGKEIVDEINNVQDPNLSAYAVSLGTKFMFSSEY